MGRSHDVVQLLSPRPHTAQPLSLPLPPPFSQTQHLLSSPPLHHSRSKSSLLDTNLSIKPNLSSSWKYDSRFKRTIETVTTGVEKFIGKMGKMGLSRPLRPPVEYSNMKGPTNTAKKNGTTESNSIGRPYRSKSKVSRRKPSISQSTLSTSPKPKTLERQDFDTAVKLQSASAILSAASLQSLAFPSTAGAGAKAAVAQHKRSYLRLNDMAVDPPQPVDDIQDHSDLEITTTQSWADSMDLDAMESETLPDPVQYLPSEIIYMIFSQLDQESLESASKVSKAWADHATSNAVWRDFFLSNYTPHKEGRSSYLQIGGLGVGKNIRGPQPWREMAQARLQLEKNWQKASPAATYFCGHTDSVYCCQFDEEKIITGSRDRTIRVWDLKTKKCVKVIGSPLNKPAPVPAQQMQLAVHQNTVKNVPSVNGTPEGESIFHVPQFYHHASILCLQFDDKIMVTGSSDSTCIVWDMKTYQPIGHLKHHRSGVLDICFDGEHIVSCSKDNTICIWSRDTFELVKVLTGHSGPVNAVQMRGKKLVSASGDGTARLWDMEALQFERAFISKDRGLAAVEFSDDGKHILAGGNDQVIYKFDANTAEVVHVYHGHTNLVRSLYLDCNNRRVLSGSYDQGIRLYDFDGTGKEIGVFNNWTTSWILSAKCDYRRIVATSQDGRVLLMDFGHDIPGIDLLSSI